MAQARNPSNKKKRRGTGKARMSRELGLVKKRRRAVGALSAPQGVRLEAVRVVLVEPVGAANVGQCARALLNMGLTRLYLVRPTQKWRSSESRQMAVGAAWELLKNAVVCQSLPEALEGCTYSLALTAGKGRTRVRVRNFGERLAKLADHSQAADVALVFGGEVSGLSNEQIHRCHEAVRLLVSEHYASLNLAQAVLLASFEVFAFGREAPEAVLPPMAPHEQLEGLLAQIRRVLERTDFLPKQSPDLLFEQIRALFGKVPLEDREVRILRGIFSHFEWNLDHPEKIGK